LLALRQSFTGNTVARHDLMPYRPNAAKIVRSRPATVGIGLSAARTVLTIAICPDKLRTQEDVSA
jgi:hypothetical protein